MYNRVVTGDIIIAEFLQGFRDERDFLEAKKKNGKFGIQRLSGKGNSNSSSTEFFDYCEFGITDETDVSIKENIKKLGKPFFISNVTDDGFDRNFSFKCCNF